MGYSLSWLAVKGKPPETVRQELGLQLTGKREEIPEADLSAAELPDGWYLIVSNRTEQVASDAAMQRLSVSGCRLVTCFVEEHVMYSRATCWRNGRQIWSVIHNAQKGRDHLESEGELPSAFESILTGLRTRQREADALKQRVDLIFDVPVELVHNQVGYRHDRDNPALRGPVFEVLSGAAMDDSAPATKTPSFFKRLFGG